MKLEESPKWVQEIVIEKALGLLMDENATASMVTDKVAIVRAFGYTYRFYDKKEVNNER